MMAPKPRPGQKGAPAQALGTSSDDVATAAAMAPGGSDSSAAEHDPTTAAYDASAGSTHSQGEQDLDTAESNIYGALLTLEDATQVARLSVEQLNHMQRMLATREVTEVEAAIQQLKPKGSRADKDHMRKAAMHAMEAGAALLNQWDSSAASTDPGPSESAEGEPSEEQYNSFDTLEAECMEVIDSFSSTIISEVTALVEEKAAQLKESVRLQIQQAAGGDWR